MQDIKKVGCGCKQSRENKYFVSAMSPKNQHSKLINTSDAQPWGFVSGSAFFT